MKLHYTPKKFECNCCHALKPANEFGTQSYTGIRNEQCKECISIKRRAQRGKQKHGKFISKEKCRNFVDEIDYTLDDWRDALLHFRGRCCYCGKPEGRAKADRFDREHLVPVSKGGKTVRENVVPACRKCNRARGNKDLLTWFRAQESWDQSREDKVVAWMEGNV